MHDIFKHIIAFFTFSLPEFIRVKVVDVTRLWQKVGSSLFLNAEEVSQLESLSNEKAKLNIDGSSVPD